MNRDFDNFYYLEKSNKIAPLQLSEQSGYIKLLKRKLKEKNYYKGEINDSFDVDVRNAVMNLQKDYSLALTGIIDDRVLEVLLNPSHASISKEEYISDDVIILEMKLRKAGPSTVEIKEEIGSLYPPIIYEMDVYTVKPGDTLWALSKRFNTTVEEIMITNKLHNTLLSIGQKLLVPRNIVLEKIPNIYIVKPGDNLWAISRKFSTTVDNIIDINNLTSINLSIGQKLIIPN